MEFKIAVDTIWVILCAALVFCFALLESGLCRSKTPLILLSKNVIVFGVNTNMAACAGLVASTLASIFIIGKSNLSMALNGALSGLAAITVGCDGVSIFGSVIIGLIAGILVVYSVIFFDKIKVDDPAGALSVHLVHGTWGVLAVTLFHLEEGLFHGGEFAKLKVKFSVL